MPLKHMQINYGDLDQHFRSPSADDDDDDDDDHATCYIMVKHTSSRGVPILVWPPAAMHALATATNQP
jgi:hypothetical protein